MPPAIIKNQVVRHTKEGNMKQKKIIGAKVRLLKTIKSRGGIVINKGEEATIVQSYRGYGVREGLYREVNKG